MTSSLTVTGIRLEPRVDDVVEWSRGEDGELEFGPDTVTFMGWSVPYVLIQDAVLNSERMYLRKVQCLALKAETGQYMFTLHQPIATANDFPFPVRVTERRTLVGKWVFLGVAVFILKLTWDILRATADNP